MTQESRLSGYISHPYNRFLQLRVEFLILTQNEVEAKIMRIIEWCVEIKRQDLYLLASAHTPKGHEIAIPEEVWSPISHRFFLEQLFGVIQSETTIKDALASLEKKHLIFKKPGGGKKYDAPLYTLNKPLISKLYTFFPEKLSDLDMSSIMKQPRKKKDPEGHLLPLPIIDPLVEKLRAAINDPLNHQLLSLSTPIIAPMTELGGGQLLPPKRESKDILKKIKEEAVPPCEQIGEQSEMAPVAAALSLLKKFSQDQVRLLLEMSTRIQISEQTADVIEKYISQRIVPTFSEGSPPVLSASVFEHTTNAVEPVSHEKQEPPLQKPSFDVSRSAETIVSLVEFLRGQRYSVAERPRELRAAFKLLNLQPEWSLADIESSWLHGSDDYWRNMHNGEAVHVHDLVNRDSNGKYRMLAFLEHKRGEDRRAQQSLRSREAEVSISLPASIQQQPVMKQSALSEEQAQVIIAQIALDAVTHGYPDLRGELKAEDLGWKVRVSWSAPFLWKGDLGLEISSVKQWQQTFVDWQEVLQIHETRTHRQKKA